jgi:DNA-binding IclR family transcriptional regulator
MTTKTKTVLARLAEGPKTFKDIVDGLDMDETDMRRLIGYLQKRGYIETVPLTYQLTSAGEKRHAFKPKSSPQKIARVHARNQAIRARERMDIASVSHRQPNSVFALGQF